MSDVSTLLQKLENEREEANTRIKVCKKARLALIDLEISQLWGSVGGLLLQHFGPEYEATRRHLLEAEDTARRSYLASEQRYANTLATLARSRCADERISENAADVLMNQGGFTWNARATFIRSEEDTPDTYYGPIVPMPHQVSNKKDFLRLFVDSTHTSGLRTDPCDCTLFGTPCLEVSGFHLSTVNPETVKQFAIFIASLAMYGFIALSIGETDNLPLRLVPLFLRSMVEYSPRCVFWLTISIGKAVINKDFAQAICEINAHMLTIKGPENRSIMKHLGAFVKNEKIFFPTDWDLVTFLRSYRTNINARKCKVTLGDEERRYSDSDVSDAYELLVTPRYEERKYPHLDA